MPHDKMVVNKFVNLFITPKHWLDLLSHSLLKKSLARSQNIFLDDASSSRIKILQINVFKPGCSVQDASKP